MTLTPRPYQLEGRDFLARTRIALLADEMRVGKTPQAILAAAAVRALNILVLCPAIAVPMWRYQFNAWWPPAQARFQLAVLSYEKALLKKAELLSQNWDVTIIDECHFAGNPEAKRTQMIYGVDGLAWRSRHLWALSGTPAPKHAGSLWPLLTAAGVVSMSYEAFIRHYCRIDFLSQRPVGTKEEQIPELRALWQQIGLRRTRKQVAPEMPDIGFDFLPIELDKAVHIAEPNNFSDDLLLANLERQADVDREDRIAVALAKAEKVVDEVAFALANNLLKHTVVFGWHLEPLRRAAASLKAMGFNVEMLSGETSAGRRLEIQERFKLGLTDVVVGQIRACGTAIDLSTASHGYFIELDWVPANNLQAANRLVSLDKAEGVTVDIATMPGSVDDRVQRVLMRRARELNLMFAV